MSVARMCEAGVKYLAQFYPNVTALRDVTLEQLEQHRMVCLRWFIDVAGT